MLRKCKDRATAIPSAFFFAPFNMPCGIPLYQGDLTGNVNLCQSKYTEELKNSEHADLHAIWSRHAVHGQKLLDMGMLRFFQVRHGPKVNRPAFKNPHPLTPPPPHQVQVVGDYHGRQPKLILQPQHEIDEMVAHDG